MALTGAQYQSMRTKFLGLLGSPYQGVSSAELDSFISQLAIDATGSVTAAQKSQAETLLVGHLTSPQYTPIAADIGTFIAQLVSSAPVIISALTGPRYLQLKQQLTGTLSYAGIRTEAQMLAYISSYLDVNFGALVPGVALYLRSDLGLGKTGSVVNTWANQAGVAGNVTENTGTVGIASVSTGVGGRAGVAANGTTQNGVYSYSLANPGTTPHFKYCVYQSLRNTGAHQFLEGNSGFSLTMFQPNGTNNIAMFAGTQQTATAAANTWARTYQLYTNSTSDVIKYGSAAQVTGTNAGNGGGGTTRGIFGDELGSNRAQAEIALLILATGVTLGNLAATVAALDAAVNSFYGAGNVQL